MLYETETVVRVRFTGEEEQELPVLSVNTGRCYGITGQIVHMVWLGDGYVYFNDVTRGIDHVVRSMFISDAVMREYDDCNYNGADFGFDFEKIQGLRQATNNIYLGVG